MIVMKFGGSSVANEDQIHKVCQIVKERIPRRPVIVSSAHKGVTDALLDAGRAAVRGEPDAGPVVELQRKVLRGCGCDHDLLDPFFREIEDLLRGISLVREASPRSLDYLASFGERMSVRVIADYFLRHGIKAEAFDAWTLGFIVDEHFGEARPLPGYEQMIATEFERHVGSDVVPVITGFVGKTSSGEIATVGRNGSDFSATCFASALQAAECEIWTDTDGVMTADPRLVQDARSIPFMSFAEASELAYYGGRVLHPSTLLPAVKRRIPVRVLNTNHPDHPGTVITEEGGDNPNPVTSIAYKPRQAVIMLESTSMLGTPGFLARVFDILGREDVDIDMISTSEVSVSMTCDGESKLNGAIRELDKLGRVTVVTDKSIVCIVGKNVKDQQGLGATIFAALRDADVNVEMISQGANKINISLLIDDGDVKAAIPALHGSLFK
jgi:aspartate kinase